MFKMIKKTLLAALLLSAAVAPVRVDAINAGALSLIKRALCIGGGVGFGGLTGLFSAGAYQSVKFVKHQQKNQLRSGDWIADGFDRALTSVGAWSAVLSTAAAISSTLATYFLFTKGLK